MREISEILSKITLPRMFQARQIFPRPYIPKAEIPEHILTQLRADKISASIKQGMRVCLTGSSRGISNQALILRTIADYVKSLGAEPFVVPAMGSHGGITSEGQRAILAGYDIREEVVGCPIYASMDTTYIGDTEDGRPVYIDKYAAQADGIILSNRIKLHTGFRGPYESGLMKMMAIGLGKQKGAETCHNAGMHNMPISIPVFGRAILKHAPILFGVGIIENAYDETAKIAVLHNSEIESEEPKLLEEARTMMPRIIVGSCDVLIVDQLGKNFSGNGLDPNVVGNFSDMSLCPDFALKHQRIGVLDVSDESNGHCTGVGWTHATTRRLFDKFSFEATYANTITFAMPDCDRIPPVMDNDRECIQFCIQTCTGIDRNDCANLRIIRIPNTLQLEHIQLSEAYYDELARYDGIIAESEPETLSFDKNGNLF